MTPPVMASVYNLAMTGLLGRMRKSRHDQERWLDFLTHFIETLIYLDIVDNESELPVSFSNQSDKLFRKETFHLDTTFDDLVQVVEAIEDQGRYGFAVYSINRATAAGNPGIKLDRHAYSAISCVPQWLVNRLMDTDLKRAQEEPPRDMFSFAEQVKWLNMTQWEQIADHQPITKDESHWIEYELATPGEVLIPSGSVRRAKYYCDNYAKIIATQFLEHYRPEEDNHQLVDIQSFVQQLKDFDNQSRPSRPAELDQLIEQLDLYDQDPQSSKYHSVLSLMLDSDIGLQVLASQPITVRVTFD